MFEIIIWILLTLMFIGWLGNFSTGRHMSAEEHRYQAEVLYNMSTRHVTPKRAAAAYSQAEAHIRLAEQIERQQY